MAGPEGLDRFATKTPRLVTATSHHESVREEGHRRLTEGEHRPESFWCGHSPARCCPQLQWLPHKAAQ